MRGDYVPTIARPREDPAGNELRGLDQLVGRNGRREADGLDCPGRTEVRRHVNSDSYVIGGSSPFPQGAQTNPIDGPCLAAIVIPDPANTTLIARQGCLTQDCSQEKRSCRLSVRRRRFARFSIRSTVSSPATRASTSSFGWTSENPSRPCSTPPSSWLRRRAHNNDGYIIIAVSAHADHSLGGDTNQGR
jgi:hypothetical protein